MIYVMAVVQVLLLLAVWNDLWQFKKTIMSAISDFAAKQDAHNDAIDTAITGLQGDVQGLKDEIAKLQASSGTVTAEDQASLDRLETRAAAISDKLAALDALTPPVPPV